jgi:ABC-type amino acid transport substrate-binding protein
MGGDFVRATKEIPLNIDTADGEPQNFIKLYHGRYDLFFCYEISGRFWVNANPDLKERIRIADKPVLENLSFYLPISKKSKAIDLMPKIDAVIASMTTDGTMQRLRGLGGR